MIADNNSPATHCRFCKRPYAIINGEPNCKCGVIPATRFDVYVIEEKLNEIIKLINKGAGS